MNPQQPPPDPHTLREVLEFIATQNRENVAHFDRLSAQNDRLFRDLLQRSTWVGVALLGLFSFFGYKNMDAVEAIRERTFKELETVREQAKNDVLLIREQAKNDVTATVRQETTPEKVSEHVQAALQKFSETRLKALVDSAAKGIVEPATRDLRERAELQTLAERATSEGEGSRAAFTELRSLSQQTGNPTLAAAATAQFNNVNDYWEGRVRGHIEQTYRIPRFQGESVQETALTTCQVVTVLKSSNSTWKDRARAAMLLRESPSHRPPFPRGVIQALAGAAGSDLSLEVSSQAIRTLRVHYDNDNEIEPELKRKPWFLDQEFLARWLTTREARSRETDQLPPCD